MPTCLPQMAVEVCRRGHDDLVDVRSRHFRDAAQRHSRGQSRTMLSSAQNESRKGARGRDAVTQVEVSLFRVSPLSCDHWMRGRVAEGRDTAFGTVRASPVGHAPRSLGENARLGRACEVLRVLANHLEVSRTHTRRATTGERAAEPISFARCASRALVLLVRSGRKRIPVRRAGKGRGNGIRVV